MAVTLDLNGERHELDVDAEMPLLWAIRDHLKLTGTKFGCGMVHTLPFDLAAARRARV